MSSVLYTHAPSPLGPLLLVGSGEALTAIWLPSGRDRRDPEPSWIESPKPFRDAVRQLDAYFAGKLRQFDLPLAPEGTPFQRRVWQALLGIPYGETVSYGSIALALGRMDRVRAVGAAVGSTPVPIVVPCHRVIGADGSLTGYGGGLPRKRWLLDHEAAAQGRLI